MFLHFIYRNISTIQRIISLLQRQGMIPHKRSFTEHLIQMFRSFCFIQFIFVCNHILLYLCTKIAIILHIYKLICKCQLIFVYLSYERNRIEFYNGSSDNLHRVEARWFDSVVVVVGFSSIVDSHRILVDYNIHRFNNSISRSIEVWQN